MISTLPSIRSCCLPKQIDRCSLPRIPIKKTERRAAKFEHAFGAGSVELDALEALHPGELRKIVEDGILRHLDPDLEDRELKARRAIREYIERAEEEVHGRYQEQIDAVQEKYSQLRQQMADLREHAQDLWHRIADDLEAEAPYVCDDDVPQARDESHQLTPLFDSGRDYLTQLDSYRRWQGRTGEAS
jgi:hypothetical protein